jgi:predicted dehydrogenase
MDHVRLGVIGCGSMAQSHMGYFDKVRGLKFTAASDTDPATLKKVTDKYGVKGFDDGHKLIESGECDAILIATPHYFHPEYSMAGFHAGLHVLCEKPVAVTARDAEQVNAAYEKVRGKGVLYAAMFNQRTRADWRQVRKMVRDGAVGELIRVSWTITNWFRTQSYYDSGGWRATWKGEGGGVLINQCPHNLDLFQWFVGMPSKVHAMVGLGKHHDIEVEDDVVAMLEFDNGAVGTFITSTGEAPGINRLEIVGDNGTLIAGDGGFRFIQNNTPVREFCRNSPERFATPERTTYTIDPGGNNPEHRGITQNFVDVILGREEKLIAEGVEGIHGLELGNAMLMSGVTGKPVGIPTDRQAYHDLIQNLIKNSRFEKKVVKQTAAADLAGSF